MKVTVTGGASFIGSHLVEKLLEKGHSIKVIDNLSSGSQENLKGILKDIELIVLDLRVASPVQIAKIISGSDILYHLAADHGGRGYVELKQTDCSNSLAIDNNVFMACIYGDVRKVIYASSGCVYPLDMQNDTDQMLYLNEDDIGPPYEPDGIYGLAKLAGELTLKVMYEEHQLESTCCRFFTVYGPRGKENHAIMSFIARAFIQRNPFEIWGDGTQIRNWTYVDDIVNGLLVNLKGHQALNIGTTERTRVIDAVQMTLNVVNKHYYKGEYNPEILLQRDMPVGPLNRVADNSKLLNLNGIPLMNINLGIERTVDWYFKTKDKEYIEKNLDRLLIARQ
jgi:nucleoside-diphosphate-sugar epimerase